MLVIFFIFYSIKRVKNQLSLKVESNLSKKKVTAFNQIISVEFFDNMIRPVVGGGALNVLFANATSQMTSGNNVLASKTKKTAHTGVNRSCDCMMVLSTEIRFSVQQSECSATPFAHSVA